MGMQKAVSVVGLTVALLVTTLVSATYVVQQANALPHRVNNGLCKTVEEQAGLTKTEARVFCHEFFTGNPHP